MGAPAAAMGDRVSGVCTHLVPTPSGAPAPTPLPFSAPLTQGLATSVLVGGRPAAVVGSWGLNVPPHAGIVDAFAAPPAQRGTVLQGSATVLVENRPAARSGSSGSTCTSSATLTGTATTILVGG